METIEGEKKREIEFVGVLEQSKNVRWRWLMKGVYKCMKNRESFQQLLFVSIFFFSFQFKYNNKN